MNVGENRKKIGNKTHVLMEKLLTPIARTLPVSRSFSISAQASLKLTLSVVLTEPSGFLGSGFPSALNRSQSSVGSRGQKGREKKTVPS